MSVDQVVNQLPRSHLPVGGSTMEGSFLPSPPPGDHARRWETNHLMNYVSWTCSLRQT